MASANRVIPDSVPDLHASPPRRSLARAPSILDEADDPEPPPFPLQALPPAMADLIAAVARTERVPIPLPAVCALGTVSAAIGAGLEVASGPNRFTRGNLYLLASAESGSGKSETFRIVAAPLLEHQSRILETWRSTTGPIAKEKIATLEAQIAKLTRETTKKDIQPGDCERINAEKAKKRSQIIELTAIAAMPCIIAADVTTERLAGLLQENREVIFSASPDARKLIDNLMGRYNPGKTTDESLYLSAFSGDFVRVDRQGREPIILQKPCLALSWFFQPDLMETMLGELSLTASGFLARPLVCHTNAAPRRIEGAPEVMPESVLARWTQLVSGLLATFHDAKEPFRIEPSPEAAGILINYHNAIVDRRAGDLADIGTFAARYAENAWRMSVVLHAAQWADQAGRQPLASDTAANGVRLVDWFAQSQQEILAKGRRKAAVKVQDEVLELLTSNAQRKAQDYTTAREVYRARIRSTPEAAKALLAGMEAAGILVGEEVRPQNGGPTSRIYRRIHNPVPE